ncbi:MAG TPA: NADH-quinone oxidoreductase subunit N, partial [Usitatibacteraceae bacterium]|nr:NADH-quinone oxidoreductase subunit N [Usitatibacteraceae bacterium]
MNFTAVSIAMAPEHLLLAGIVALLVLDIVSERSRAALPLAVLFVVASTVAALILGFNGWTGAPFPGQFVLTPPASFAKALVLALAVPVLMFSKDDFGEGAFYPLVLSSLYGVCLLASAESFLTLFLGIELMSIPVYVLVLIGFRRDESAEAALKYLVLSGTASASFLMGASLMYGSTGSLGLPSFGAALSSPDLLARTAVVMVVAAFFLKAAIVPFHGWAPDAYEAASIPSTAYMAVLVKAGVLIAAARVFGTAPVTEPLAGLLAVLPLASMVWGNLTAMRQPTLRRMIAYSSIAHAGYLFFAFLGDGPGRFQAVLFYLATYGVMNLLAFAALPSNDNDLERDRLENLKGLFRTHPFAALLIAMSMLSLAGIPPFPGFVGKFLIFKNVMAAGYTTWAVLGLVGSYIGIYFYLRVIQFMFMSPGTAAAGHAPSRGIAMGASLLCLAGSILIAVLPGIFLARF